MATYLTDHAICLRVHDFSETSQVVGLFTRKHGLVPLIAKGSKRQSKKNAMSGPLDLLTAGEVVFVPAREADRAGTAAAALGTLAAWELSNHRQGLRANLPALNAAMLCAEVTAHLLQPLDPHEELFTEFDAALDLLANAPQPARVALAYLKAALVSAGYWPRFGGCLVCGRPPASAEGQVRFSPSAGGILCVRFSSGASPGTRSCQIDNPGTTLAISARIALALDRMPLPAALAANPPERPAEEASLSTAIQLLLTHIETITDKPLRTRYLLRTLVSSTKSPGKTVADPGQPVPSHGQNE